MSLRQDAIPNRALNGEEVKEIAVKEFRAMLDRECMLTRGIAYRRVAISFQATFHLGLPHKPLEVRSRTKPSEVVEGEAPLVEKCKCGHGMDLHAADGGQGCNGISGEVGADGVVRAGDRIGVDGCHCLGYEPEEAALVSVERDVTLDNPNLARVHHDMPIKLQEQVPPRNLVMQPVIPGEPPEAATNPFPEVRNTELRYDKTQYPEALAPVDRDVSERKAKELGVKSGLGLKERKR